MRWGRAAVVLELLFVSTLGVADLVDGVRLGHTVSELVYGRLSWLVVAAFVVHAASLGCLAAWRGRSRGPLLVAAVGMLVVALFWTDPPGRGSWVGSVHIAGAVLAFGGLAVAAWLERIHLPVVPLSLLVVVHTILMLAAVQEGGVFLGIVERLQIVINGAWIVNAGLAPGFSSGSGSRAA